MCEAGLEVRQGLSSPTGNSHPREASPVPGQGMGIPANCPSGRLAEHPEHVRSSASEALVSFLMPVI